MPPVVEFQGVVALLGRFPALSGFDLTVHPGEIVLLQGANGKFVDKAGGIGLDDLQSVSVEVSAILDAEDPIAGSYTLEVSSPGLDRPLKSEADYRRFVGRLAKLSSYDLVDGRRHWTGRIAACEDAALGPALAGRNRSASAIPVATGPGHRMLTPTPSGSRSRRSASE